MFNETLNRPAGALLLLFLALTVISVFTSFSFMEANPFDRSEVDDFLRDVKDNEATAIASVVFDISANIVSLAVAAVLYLVFRSRSHALALLAFAGIFASGIAFMAVSAGFETVIILADDFETGGAGELAAGSEVTLEVARATAMFTLVLEQIGSTAMGAGLVALGILIAQAPAAAGAAPPRWIGWVAAVAGLASILTWLGVLAEPFFAFFMISGPGMLIALISLGIWLLRTPDEVTMGARPSPMPA